MPQEYVKSMLQRDIQEKEAIKNTLKSLKRLFLLVTIVGILLFGALISNTIITTRYVLKNREETFKNREYGVIIIQKLDSSNAILYKK